MKIAIVTITDGQNYGNRLQNFALQEVLKDAGWNVETIKRKTFHNISAAKKLEQYLKRNLKKFLGRKYGKHKIWREKAFKGFNAKYIRFSKTVLHDNLYPSNFANQYDYFVAGSDQIWNAGFRIVREDIANYLLSFARPEQRIAYAASFGTDFIAEGYEGYFQKELPKFKRISVRERSGVELAASFGAEAELVLDPVMLLGQEQWSAIARKPSFADGKPFAFSYFLGDMDAEMEKYDIRIQQMGIRVCHLYSEWRSERGIQSVEEFACAPDEFVWLLEHAEYVLTDSFHAAAFSILFHKPFWVFDRKEVNDSYKIGDRINTLLEIFNLQTQRRSVSAPAALPDEPDGAAIESRLQTERQKSLLFLRNAFM